MLYSASRTKQMHAQEFLSRLVEERDVERVPKYGERRSERRTDLSTAVWVIPLDEDCPEIGKAFVAVTRDISSLGMAVVTHRAVLMPEIVICFSGKGQPVFLRARVRGQKDLGLGCFRLSLEVTELVDTEEYPQLRHFTERVLNPA